MRTKKILITYDIDLDLRILSTITLEPKEKISISNLRNYLEVHSSRLEEHIKHLVKWGMLSDKKPEKNGKARIISFPTNKTFGDCMMEILKLKEAVDLVNNYFSSK